MSRIGKSPIDIPSDVTVRVQDSVVTVEGKGGTLSQMLTDDIRVLINDNVVTLERPSDSKTHRAVHGLYRSLIFNMVMGVSEGWTKKLELVGVGFRATNRGQVLDLALGFSHNISMQIPSEVKLNTVSEKGKNPIIELTSLDKQLVGMIASKIRSLRKPEPYKGKGVRYVGEIVRKKAGKSAAK
ncbi:MAG: 50S ribosomal protein L6 [Owenweeksia sp. TMED14]|nr:MAG: 50S ribosomal protein L6 [Owenweeksia sp. TMED14]